MNGPLAAFKWEALFRDWPTFASGFGITIFVTILGLVLALVIGILLGIMSTLRGKVPRGFSRAYVEFYQNTPLVIQVFFLYNGLPIAGIVLPVLVVGVLGVGMYHGAYVAEIIRAGIQSITKGQMEAARSQGFGHWAAMRWVVLPQAMRTVLPPLANQALFLVRNTSVLAMIAGGDLMYRADSWSADTLYYGPAYIVTGVLYLIICYPLSRLARGLEARASKSVQGAHA